MKEVIHMTKKYWLRVWIEAAAVMALPAFVLIILTIFGVALNLGGDEIYASMMARTFATQFVAAPIAYLLQIMCDEKAEEATE